MSATGDSVGTRSTPYQGLIPYGEDDAAFFFGRGRETRLIAANLFAAPLTLLFGPSGVGKTSVLEAGAVHALRRRDDLLVVVFRSWLADPAHGLDPVAGLREETAREARAARADIALPDSAPLGDYFAACAEQLGRRVMIILDQFEEYFVYWPEQSPFELEFARAVTQSDVPVSFLVSVREDALARLDRLEGRVPNLFENFLRVDHLDRDAAREAIVGPIEMWNKLQPPHDEVKIETALVEEVLTQVEAGKVLVGPAGVGVAGGAAANRIETPYLQLVLTRLWDEEMRAGSKTLRLATLNGLGGAQRIVRTHLDAALGSLSRAEQRVAASVFRYLVTPSGTKIAHRVSDLADYAELGVTDVEPVLAKLAGGVRIVRSVGDSSYEIYHDVLAAAILDWRARYAAAELERKRRLRRRIGVAALVTLLGTGFAAALAAWRISADRATQAQEEVAALSRAVAYYRSLLIGHEGAVRSAAFSPDGQLVVTAGVDGTARVWRWASQRDRERPPLAVLGSRSAAPLQQASFDRRGHVVTGSEDGVVEIWDWRAGRRVRTVESTSSAELTSASLDVRGDRLLISSADGAVEVWDLATGRMARPLVSRRSAVRAAAFSPDGKLVVTASDDGAARVWGSAGNILAVLRAGGPLSAAAFSPDGTLVVTAGDPGVAQVWEWRSGKRLVILPHEDVRAAGFGSDGELVVTAGSDGTAQVWDWEARRQLSALRGHGDSLNQAAFSPNGRLVATASDDATARVWTVVRPDMAIRIVDWRVAAGKLYITADASNVGDAGAPDTRALIAPAGWTAATARVPPLKGNGGTAAVTIALDIPQRAAGTTRGFVAEIDPRGEVADPDPGNNRSPPVEIAIPSDGPGPGPAPLPDLVSIQPRAAVSRDGQTVQVTVTVLNRGQADAPTTAVEISAPGWKSQRAKLGVVRVRSAISLRLGVSIPPGARGRETTFTVELDPGDGVPESSEENNRSSATVVVPEGLPDLRVETLAIDVIRGAVVVTVVVANVGEFVAPPALVVVEMKQGGWAPATSRVQSLGPSQSIRIEVPLQIPPRARGSLVAAVATVDPTGEVQEADESNNTDPTAPLRVP